MHALACDHTGAKYDSDINMSRTNRQRFQPLSPSSRLMCVSQGARRGSEMIYPRLCARCGKNVIKLRSKTELASRRFLRYGDSLSVPNYCPP